MDLTLKNIQDNALFHRKDVQFEIAHDGATTPNRQQAKQLIASEMGSTVGKVIVAYMSTSAGKAVTVGKARVYEDVEYMAKIERKHFIKRNEKKAESEE